MASLQTSSLLPPSSCCSSSKRINAAIHLPKLPKVSFSVPKIHTRKPLVQQVHTSSTETIPSNNNVDNFIFTQIYDDLDNSSTISKATIQLYAILEVVVDRVEMDNNLGEQRDNWNALLLNSINMITLTASIMAGVAAASYGGAPPLWGQLPPQSNE